MLHNFVKVNSTDYQCSECNHITKYLFGETPATTPWINYGCSEDYEGNKKRITELLNSFDMFWQHMLRHNPELATKSVKDKFWYCWLSSANLEKSN